MKWDISFACLTSNVFHSLFDVYCKVKQKRERNWVSGDFAVMHNILQTQSFGGFWKKSPARDLSNEKYVSLYKSLHIVSSKRCHHRNHRNHHNCCNHHNHRNHYDCRNHHICPNHHNQSFHINIILHENHKATQASKASWTPVLSTFVIILFTCCQCSADYQCSAHCAASCSSQCWANCPWFHGTHPPPVFAFRQRTFWKKGWSMCRILKLGIQIRLQAKSERQTLWKHGLTVLPFDIGLVWIQQVLTAWKINLPLLPPWCCRNTGGGWCGPSALTSDRGVGWLEHLICPQP